MLPLLMLLGMYDDYLNRMDRLSEKMQQEQLDQIRRSSGYGTKRWGLLGYAAQHERYLMALPAYVNFQANLQEPDGTPIDMYGIDIPLDDAAIAAGHFAGELA